MALINSTEKNEWDLIIEPGRTEKNYWKDLWRYGRKYFTFVEWKELLPTIFNCYKLFYKI